MSDEIFVANEKGRKLRRFIFKHKFSVFISAIFAYVIFYIFFNFLLLSALSDFLNPFLDVVFDTAMLFAGAFLAYVVFRALLHRYLYPSVLAFIKRDGILYALMMPAFQSKDSKYDFGDNTWLGNTNQDGEFAVAYYGVNNLFHHNIQMIQNIVSFMGNLESGKTFMDEVNIRKPGEKCMAGAYFYKNPEIAENSSEIINIGGFDYKIMFMCRVNSKKIRQPQNFQELWILSPTPDEIRPYKILIKKIPKTSLANASQQNIKMLFNNPPNSYFQIIQKRDESYFNKNTSGISNLDFVLKQYTGSMYSYVNTYLRDGVAPNNNIKDVNSTVWCLHKAITENNQNVQNGVLLYRGVCKKLPKNIIVGSRFYFPEFISTSKDINVAKSFGGSGTLMYITVQNNGTNGKKVYCRDVSAISNFPHEKEILFTSFCRFRVTKIEKSGGWDILHLICEG